MLPELPACDENEGRGWTGQVVSYSQRLDAARVAFTHAVTPRGINYEDVELQLGILSPI